MIDNKEFLEYCKSARNEFTDAVNNAEVISNYLMTAIDSFLICFDQMKDRLHKSPSTPVKDGWVSEKPNKECVFISATKYDRNDEDLLWDYSVWQIKNLVGEDEAGEPAWYFGLLNGEGEEWGDLEDLKADKYLILPFTAK